MRRNHQRQRGFTLLEVLVALAVLAIALGAVIRVAGDSASHVADLRDRTLASWVASNRINELLLADDWPGLGPDSGTSTLADRPWTWTVQVSQTSDPDLRRLDVAVGREGGPALVNLSAFRGRSQ